MNDLSNWVPCVLPPKTLMVGKYAKLDPIVGDQHFDDLWEAYSGDHEGKIWAYLPYGPFENKSDFLAFAKSMYFGNDPMFHALIDVKTGRAVGVASLMRINEAHGVIEVGHICYAPVAQQTPMTTEALYLFGCRIFDELGYRRFEWKCNAANRASCRAAERFGFSFEGTFRQAMVVKGQNRDTAWFSIIDSEWPKLKLAYEAWLADDNFDENGQQKKSLGDLKG